MHMVHGHLAGKTLTYKIIFFKSNKKLKLFFYSKTPVIFNFFLTLTLDPRVMEEPPFGAVTATTAEGKRVNKLHCEAFTEKDYNVILMNSSLTKSQEQLTSQFERRKQL